MAQVSPPTVSDARVEEALLSYWDEPRISQNADPFIYWQQNENKHPEVFLIAKAAFSCPSGSVDSERLFSTAGNVINVRRTRLNPENAEDQIFLAKNLPLQMRPSGTHLYKRVCLSVGRSVRRSVPRFFNRGN